MKSSSRETLECGLTQALLTDIPDKPQSRLRKNIVIACGIGPILLGRFRHVAAGQGRWRLHRRRHQIEPAELVATGQVRGIPPGCRRFGVFGLELLRPAGGRQGVQPAGQFDDQTYAALQAFAQRAGTEQPTSIKDLPKLAAKKKGGDAPAHMVGSKVCATCHAAMVADFDKTLMGKIGKARKGTMECENCHGLGSAHVAAGGGRGVGGILSFGKDDPRSVDERNGVCLGCHQRGERTYWAGSIHETRGLACTNCHTVMKNVSLKHNLKTTVEAETCYQCHKIKRAQMQYSSHMPVREGKLTCSNCHNPHGSITEKLIRQASVNENCYTCHAEKRGPMLWEHAAGS